MKTATGKAGLMENGLNSTSIEKAERLPGFKLTPLTQICSMIAARPG